MFFRVVFYFTAKYIPVVSFSKLPVSSSTHTSMALKKLKDPWKHGEGTQINATYWTATNLETTQNWPAPSCGKSKQFFENSCSSRARLPWRFWLKEQPPMNTPIPACYQSLSQTPPPALFALLADEHTVACQDAWQICNYKTKSTIVSRAAYRGGLFTWGTLQAFSLGNSHGLERRTQAGEKTRHLCVF